jgi:hypothetical protein
MSIDYKEELQKLIKAFDYHKNHCIVHGSSHWESILKAVESARATLCKSDSEEKLEDSIDDFISQCRPLDPEIAAELNPDVLWRLYDDHNVDSKDSSDDDMYNTFGQAKKSFVYDGPTDNWPNREERAATIYGLKAVLARWGNTSQQTDETKEDLLHLIRFMCQTWAMIDEWAMETATMDTIGTYPLVQGTSNQISLRKIGSQPFDKTRLQRAIKYMLDNKTKDN